MTQETFSARDLVRRTLQGLPGSTHPQEQRMTALDEAARASGRLQSWSRCGPVLGLRYCMDGQESEEFYRPAEALLAAAATEEEAERAARR